MFHVLHNKVALLIRKNSERGTKNCHQRCFRKVSTIFIENIDQKMNFFYDSGEIEIRLSLYRYFSTFRNIFGGICVQVFCSSAWVRNDSKSFVS